MSKVITIKSYHQLNEKPGYDKFFVNSRETNEQ